MLSCLFKNAIMISSAIGFLAIAAYCQLQIPSILAQGLTNITNGNHSLKFFLIFSLSFLCKIFAQSIGNSLAAYAEACTRFFLISSVVHNPSQCTIGSRITLIKEDAERVASAVHDFIHLAGSCILTFATAYTLLNENAYFTLPIIIITALTSTYIKYGAARIEKMYTIEIEQEELYKDSIIKTLNIPATHKEDSTHHLNKSLDLLKKATHARYRYNKASLVMCFWPELLIALGTAFVIIIIASSTPELFGTKLIAYLGYIGIFTMASANSIKLAIALIGVNISIKRIFKEA
ncbi:hypothetical protein PHLH6_56570 [Pseudomonas sp. Seg1]|uniref:ABC transporter ATP-binding protein n=1 Tax=Pseudomonas sp. Seg1 TaxID=2678259 RepID=UPI001BB367D8|nr:ABC transporter ATP-binding protein [Pseudomonas sp. Seg1]BBP73653.1 hypothetical protein PHLH6_56570 [Pseudomonas sp. Seg1]